jgi:hypothetical protein
MAHNANGVNINCVWHDKFPCFSREAPWPAASTLLSLAPLWHTLPSRLPPSIPRPWRSRRLAIEHTAFPFIVELVLAEQRAAGALSTGPLSALICEPTEWLL